MSEQDLVIHDMFAGIAAQFGARIALQINEADIWRTVTYRELETASLKVAGFLIKQGFKRDDRAALVLENRPEWPVIYLGLMYAGLTCVPLDPELSKQELHNLIADSEAKIIFSSWEVFAKKINPDLDGQRVKMIVLDPPDSQEGNFTRFRDVLNSEPDKNILPIIHPEDTASLIYTSGTTGEPKGVLLTHKNICSNFKSIEKLNICLPSDNFISVLPLYHTYAFTVTLITPLFLGAKVTYFDLKLKPQELTSIIKEARVTLLVGVPQIFAMLEAAISDKIKNIPSLLLPLAKPFIKLKLRNYFGADLRLLVSGGARLEPKVGRSLTKLGFTIIEGYGLTETSPIVTLNPPGRCKFGSVGRPIPDVQVKIVEPDKSGIGEVLIKGPNVMKGYFKQPELTGQIIRDGWFHSGDSGFIDKDGYLFLTGRIKEVIVLSSGKNIYPDELQDYYGKSPYIKEICILPKTEERFGHKVESLFAVVVPDFQYFRQKDALDIRARVRWELENLAKELPAHKHIMGFTLTKEELPRTALKKIKRYQVREKYLEEKITEPRIKETALLEENAGIMERDISKRVINYLSSQLKRPVSLDSHLEIDLGIDSLSRVELGLGLGSLLRLKIPDEAFSNVSTVRDLITAISDMTEKGGKAASQDIIEQKSWQQILKEVPEEKILNKIRFESSFLEKFANLIFKGLFISIFRVFWLLRIKGRANIPLSGPCIICPNHASYLDGFFVFSSLRLKQSANTYFLGYSDIFQLPLISWANKLARLIPIDPNTRLSCAMQTVAYVLERKKIVCIFPEGRRSVNENIAEFKKGVGILIKELDIPVVPVYIKGSHRSWPRTSRFPRFYPVKVTFGAPLSAKELAESAKSEVSGDDYEAIARGLKQEVMKLSC